MLSSREGYGYSGEILGKSVDDTVTAYIPYYLGGVVTLDKIT
jgi:hypothetical protein